jgi:hypothetical protein
MPYTYDEWERKVLLRRALTSALRAGRHLDLVAPEAPTTQRPSPQLALGLTIALLFWCAAATAGDRLAPPLEGLPGGRARPWGQGLQGWDWSGTAAAGPGVDAILERQLAGRVACAGRVGVCSPCGTGGTRESS